MKTEKTSSVQRECKFKEAMTFAFSLLPKLAIKTKKVCNNISKQTQGLEPKGRLEHTKGNMEPMKASSTLLP